MRSSLFRRKLACLVLSLTFSTHFVLVSAPHRALAQVRPSYDLGASGIGQALRKLQTTASVMHTGAHPDDEDSGLMAYFARKEQARTAYLSLTRGDGGQNVIGQELFEGLGVIRTEELLQARRIDGGEQFFTRAMDYGFSKTRAEAARIWNEREVLGDMVRAIRTFRPLVIVSRFSGTPADGHGQHQYAGYLTPLAFKAAGDPSQFPEQLAEGITAWQPLKLYISQGFSGGVEPTLVLNTGEFDPLIGRSYFEIAMEGRSLHRSQEMGVMELRGRQTSGLRLVENLTGGDLSGEKSIFDGIDTSISGIRVIAKDAYSPVYPKLDTLQQSAAEALRSFDPFAPQKLLPILSRGMREAHNVELGTRDPESKYFAREKRRQFETALRLSSGVVVDALVDTETVVPGQSANVTVRVFSSDRTPVSLASTKLRLPSGWSAEPIAEPTAVQARRREVSDAAAYYRVSVPSDATLTTPYWLRLPRSGYNFDWSTAGTARTFPFEPPLITAEVTLNVGGVEIGIEQPVQYRYADQILGEIRRDPSVVPAISVDVDSDLLIVPQTGARPSYKLLLTVENKSSGTSSGTARFKTPEGWTISPLSAPFTLDRRGQKTSLTFDLTVPVSASPGSYSLIAEAETGGRNFRQTLHEIAYPHIQTHRIYEPAEINVQVMDLRVSPVRVGYIMGSGDKVPDAIRRMGLDVTMLDEKMLSSADLNRFDVIVVGVRASQMRPDYVANNARLTEFMQQGGTMIVQYQQQEFVRFGLAPFPVKMDSNSRVTDENAAVKVLVPQHRLFTAPNKIGAEDWAGWVQERNLYSLTDFDRERYTALLESHDDGEPEAIGGMIYAEVGKGIFIYTSYSWFRQLPAGNRGAYRIFANLLSLGAKD